MATLIFVPRCTHPRAFDESFWNARNPFKLPRSSQLQENKYIWGHDICDCKIFLKSQIKSVCIHTLPSFKHFYDSLNVVWGPLGGSLKFFKSSESSHYFNHYHQILFPPLISHVPFLTTVFHCSTLKTEHDIRIQPSVLMKSDIKNIC